MTDPEQDGTVTLDPMIRVPFSLTGAEGRLGLFELSPQFKIATAEVTLNTPLTIVGSDADGVPKQTCLVTLGGHGRVRYGGQRVAQPLSDRRVSLYRPPAPETRLEFEPGARVRVAAFIFDPDVPLVDELHPLRAVEYTDARCTILQRITAEVLTCPYVGEAQRLFLQSRMLEAQAVLTQGEFAGAPPSGRDRACCERAREMLLDNLEAPPGLTTIAVAVGMSPSRLKAVFKRHFGKSFTELLLEERLERARFLLETGEMRIEEIAWRCGYAHVSNFSRAFTQRFGLPPTRWLGRHG
ncbi:MAG: AraC family transcriptional regulator [Chromatiales bacterium]|nr:AraC family transcriptional regulator [Chromatiales bacterium]